MDNYRANGVLGGQVQQRDGLYTNKQILHVALIIISIINTGILGTNMSVCFKSEYYSKKSWRHSCGSIFEFKVLSSNHLCSSQFPSKKVARELIEWLYEVDCLGLCEALVPNGPRFVWTSLVTLESITITYYGTHFFFNIVHRSKMWYFDPDSSCLCYHT